MEAMSMKELMNVISLSLCLVAAASPRIENVAMSQNPTTRKVTVT